MDNKNLKERIREMFFGSEATEEVVVEKTEEATIEEVEAKFVDVKLDNGDVIRVEPNVEEGATVTAISEEGAVQVEDGDYKLEDGTVISVASGVITAISAMEEEAAEEAEVEEAVEMAEVVDKDSKIEELYAKIDKAFEDIVAMESKFEAMFGVVNEDINGVKETTVKAFEQFAEEPAAEPVKPNYNKFSKKKPVNVWEKNSK